MKPLKNSFIKLTPQERLHHLPIPIIGLTGGIATGKTTVAKLLEQQGIPVINADALVKDIYGEEKTKQFIRDRHPEVFKDDEILFPLLREKFFSDPKIKTDIESYIYLRMPAAFKRAFEKFNKPAFIVYDVPLLYEKAMETRVDMTVLVYAPRKIQRERLMVRDNHLEEMAENILGQQMDIEEKKLKADFVINNSFSLEELKIEVEHFLQQIT